MDHAVGRRHVRHVVEPETRDVNGLLDLAASNITDARVILCGNGFPGYVSGKLEVERLDRPAGGEHLFELSCDHPEGRGVKLVDAHGAERLGDLGVVGVVEAFEQRVEHCLEVRLVRVGRWLFWKIGHAGSLAS